MGPEAYWWTPDQPSIAKFTRYTNVWFDQHTYHCFEGQDLEMSLSADGWDLHLQEACACRLQIFGVCSI